MRCIKKVRIYSTVDDIDRGERIKENEWSYKVAMAGLQRETDQSNDKGL
jgi:hypothetical protein